MKKNVIILIFLFSIGGCSSDSKQKKAVIKNESFEGSLNEKIDNLIDSTDCISNGRLISVRYQNYKGKEYIKIGSAHNFYTDSIYSCKIYRGNFIVIYNQKYFYKRIFNNQAKMDSLLRVYSNLDSKYNDGTILENRCFEIFEIYDNNFIKTPHNSFYYNNLFSESIVPASPPPPKLKEQ